MTSLRKYRFHPDAAQDLNDALEWYSKVLPSLPQQFHDDFIEKIEIAISYPLAYPKFGRFRRFSMSRFPHLVFYTIKVDYIIIIGIFHNQRNPEEIQTSVTKRK